MKQARVHAKIYSSDISAASPSHHIVGHIFQSRGKAGIRMSWHGWEKESHDSYPPQHTPPANG